MRTHFFPSHGLYFRLTEGLSGEKDHPTNPQRPYHRAR